MTHETYWGGGSRGDAEGVSSWTSTADQAWTSFREIDPVQWPADKLRWQWLVSQETTGSNEFEMGICRLDPGERHLLHHHPMRAELYFVTGGSATVTIGDDARRAGPGDAMYIPAGVVHGFVNDGKEIFELVFVYDHPERLARPDYVLDERVE